MREKGQTEAAKTLETPVFSRGIEILTEKLELYGYLHDVCRWYDDEQGVAQISAVMQKEQQKLERQIRSSERL